MARPTRKWSGTLGHDSDAVKQARIWIGTYLGDTDATPVARIGKVHVFGLIGTQGVGLLAESEATTDDRPGVYRTRASVWLRQAGDEVSYLIDLELHGWDAWTYASATGDRHWLEVPARAMYAERDRRTKAVSDELDRTQLSVVPAGGVPAFMAGLGVDAVRRLASAHAPAIIGSAPSVTIGAVGNS